jgi:hypothetical protein
MTISFRKLLLLALAATATLSAACNSSGTSPTSAANSASPTGIATPGSPTVVATVTPSQVASPTASAAPTGTPTPAQLPERDNLQIARDLLRYVPDTEQTRKGFWVNDYELAQQLFGVQRPDPADDEAVLQYVRQLNGLGDVPGRLMASTQYLAGHSIDGNFVMSRQKAKASVGFGPADLKRSVLIDLLHPSMEIVVGDIDPGESHALILGCDECPEAETREHSGMAHFAWGDDTYRDFRLRYSPPLFDQAGIIGRLAFADGVAWRTYQTEKIELLLDTASGMKPSLAASADHVDLSAALWSASVYSFFISSQTHGRGEYSDEEFVQFWIPYGGFGLTQEQISLLTERLVTSRVYPEAFTTYALGAGEDESGPFAVAAYVFGDSETAEQNEGAITQLVTDRIVLSRARAMTDLFDRFTVERAGRVVLVRMYDDSAPAIVYRFVADGEPFNLHQ